VVSCSESGFNGASGSSRRRKRRRSSEGLTRLAGRQVEGDGAFVDQMVVRAAIACQMLHQVEAVSLHQGKRRKMAALQLFDQIENRRPGYGGVVGERAIVAGHLAQAAASERLKASMSASFNAACWSRRATGAICAGEVMPPTRSFRTFDGSRCALFEIAPVLRNRGPRHRPRSPRSGRAGPRTGDREKQFVGLGAIERQHFPDGAQAKRESVEILLVGALQKPTGAAAARDGGASLRGRWASAARRKASVSNFTRARESSFSFDARRIKASAANSGGALRAKVETVLGRKRPQQKQGKRNNAEVFMGSVYVLYLDATGQEKDGGPNRRCRAQLVATIAAAASSESFVDQIAFTDGMNIPITLMLASTKTATMMVYSTRS